jgi:hypothetical protein
MASGGPRGRMDLLGRWLRRFGSVGFCVREGACSSIVLAGGVRCSLLSLVSVYGALGIVVIVTTKGVRARSVSAVLRSGKGFCRSFGVSEGGKVGIGVLLGVMVEVEGLRVLLFGGIGIGADAPRRYGVCFVPRGTSIMNDGRSGILFHVEHPLPSAASVLALDASMP